MLTFTVPLMLQVTHTEVRTCACMYINCTVAGNGKSFYDKRVANNRVTGGGLMRFTLTVQLKRNKWHLMQSSESDVARSTGAQGAHYSQWPRLVEIIKKNTTLD